MKGPIASGNAPGEEVHKYTVLSINGHYFEVDGGSARYLGTYSPCGYGTVLEKRTCAQIKN